MNNMKHIPTPAAAAPDTERPKHGERAHGITAGCPDCLAALHAAPDTERVPPCPPEPLDAQALAEAIAEVTGIGKQDTEHGTEYDVEGARRIAAEYAARLRDKEEHRD